MNLPGWSPGAGRKSRLGRPVAPWVERLERRRLLTLQVSPITAVAGQFFNAPVATFAAGDVQGTLADFQATIFWTGAVNLTTGGYDRTQRTGELYHLRLERLREGRDPIPSMSWSQARTIASAQASGTATVSDAPLSTSPVTISTMIETPFSGVVGSFQTTNSYATRVRFHGLHRLGRRLDPSRRGRSRPDGFGSFSVVGQHTYTTVGTLPVTVTIVSPGGQIERRELDGHCRRRFPSPYSRPG